MSRQLLDMAAQDADLETAEGRARLLAQARPMWGALPAGALRTQILGEIAKAARLEGDELARLWGLARPAAARGAGDRGAGAYRGARSSPPRVMRQSVRLPQDNVAHIVLLDSQRWDEIGAADHEMLCALDTWHAAFFTWLEREITEHGHRAWPQWREALAQQAFAETARQLVDDAAVPPTADELPRALEQTRQAKLKREAARLLGRG